MNGSLAIAVADFLAHKRALGRKYLAEEATLRLLLVFSEQQGLTELDELTTVLLDAFVASRQRARARSFNNLVNIVGGFLEWTVVQQRLETSPLRRVHRRETDQRLPFLFDTMKARRLLEAATALPDNARARDRGSTYHAIFALCYGLGLRAGEACGLLIGDVDARSSAARCAWRQIWKEPSRSTRPAHRRPSHTPGRAPRRERRRPAVQLRRETKCPSV